LPSDFDLKERPGRNPIIQSSRFASTEPTQIASFSAVILRTNCLAQPGLSQKRAAQLVRRYGTLDPVLEAGLFQTQAEMLRLYRLIATMDAAAPLPSLADQETIWALASSFARSWG
jgi:hypothetical protein